MGSYDEEVQFCYLRRNEMVTLNALEEGDWAPPTPTQAQRMETLEQENSLLRAQIEAQSGQLDFYEDCIAEMAAVVYA